MCQQLIGDLKHAQNYCNFLLVEIQFFSLVEILMEVKTWHATFSQICSQKWSASLLLGGFFCIVCKYCAVDGISGEACN